MSKPIITTPTDEEIVSDSLRFATNMSSDPWDCEDAFKRLMKTHQEMKQAIAVAYEVMTKRLYATDANPMGIVDLLGRLADPMPEVTFEQALSAQIAVQLAQPYKKED